MAVLLILAYLALILSPLAFAAGLDLPQRSLADELATGAGLVALGILLVEFVLSGRFRTVSRPFGMDVTMRFHQLMSRTALALILAHPILYTAWNRADAFDPSRQGFVSFDMHGLLPGIIAFLLLGGLVAMAIARSDLGYRYEVWRLLHGLGALAVAWFGVVHATRLGRYSQNEALAQLWWALFAIALLSLVIAYVLKPIRQWARPWRVVSVKRSAERMWHVTLSPDGHAGLRYDAGQFAWANFGHSAFGLSENPFSIASAPSAGPEVSFLIKELGDSTGQIGNLAPGTRAYLDAPHGNLAIAGRTEPGIAMIAGGVGIAPMLGILRELRATGDNRPTLLVYGNRDAGQIACRDELESFRQDLGTQVFHVLSEPENDWNGLTGCPDVQMLVPILDGKTGWLYVLCGPPDMLESTERILLDLGVPPTAILSERFVYE